MSLLHGVGSGLGGAGDSGGALIYKDNDDKNVLIGIITHFSVMDGQSIAGKGEGSGFSFKHLQPPVLLGTGRISTTLDRVGLGGMF